MTKHWTMRAHGMDAIDAINTDDGADYFMLTCNEVFVLAADYSAKLAEANERIDGHSDVLDYWGVSKSAETAMLGMATRIKKLEAALRKIRDGQWDGQWASTEARLALNADGH